MEKEFTGFPPPQCYACFTGMTGEGAAERVERRFYWIPAMAGMTNEGGRYEKK